MTPNANEVLNYMLIHLLLFLFKNFILQWILNLLKPKSKNNNDSELQLKKQKLESLKEQLREISPINEYAKYAKMERQINNLDEEIKQRENNSFFKQEMNEISSGTQNMNKCQRFIYTILNSYFFKFFMLFANIIEYLLLKNKYLEVEYLSNKNNIVVNHYYNKDDNEEYALIPVYRILICETLVLSSLSNLTQKLF